MGILQFFLLILVCLAPAIWEYRMVAASSNWAETTAFILSVKSVPVKSTSGFLSESVVEYQFKTGKEPQLVTVKSLPHMDFLNSLPTDLHEQFRAGRGYKIRFKLDNPQESVMPALSEELTVKALVQGALLAVFGAIIMIVISIGKSAY